MQYNGNSIIQEYTECYPPDATACLVWPHNHSLGGSVPEWAGWQIVQADSCECETPNRCRGYSRFVTSPAYLSRGICLGW
jgi:hypothetical protein